MLVEGFENSPDQGSSTSPLSGALPSIPMREIGPLLARASTIEEQRGIIERTPSLELLVFPLLKSADLQIASLPKIFAALKRAYGIVEGTRQTLPDQYLLFRAKNTDVISAVMQAQLDDAPGWETMRRGDVSYQKIVHHFAQVPYLSGHEARSEACRVGQHQRALLTQLQGRKDSLVFVEGCGGSEALNRAELRQRLFSRYPHDRALIEAAYHCYSGESEALRAEEELLFLGRFGAVTALCFGDCRTRVQDILSEQERGIFRVMRSRNIEELSVRYREACALKKIHKALYRDGLAAVPLVFDARSTFAYSALKTSVEISLLRHEAPALMTWSKWLSPSHLVAPLRHYQRDAESQWAIIRHCRLVPYRALPYLSEDLQHLALAKLDLWEMHFETHAAKAFFNQIAKSELVMTSAMSLIERTKRANIAAGLP